MTKISGKDEHVRQNSDTVLVKWPIKSLILEIHEAKRMGWENTSLHHVCSLTWWTLG